MFPRDLIQPVDTLQALLDRVRTEPDPDRPGITFYRGAERVTALSYGSYLAQIDAWAAFLQDQGVTSGDRVATLLRNRIEVPIFYLAAMSIGAVVVPLNPSYSPTEMSFVLDDAKPVLVLTDEPTGRDRADELTAASTVHFLEAVVLEAGRRPETVPVHGDDPAIILYTSGTTSFPKGVKQMHRNLVANAWSMVKELKIERPTQYSVMPFYHAHAVGFGMMTCLLSGGHLVMTDRMDPFVWSRVINAEQVTLTSMVPSMVQLLVRTRVKAATVPSLAFVFVSAAPLPSALAKTFEEQSGLRLAHAWGLSEYTNFATALPVDVEPELRAELMFGYETPCVGYALDGASVDVVRPDGTETEPLERGELRVQGPSLTLGYHGNSEATGNAFRDGRLYSGDEGYYVERDGIKYFFIADRIKDIIIRSGEKISPAAVEAALTAAIPELAGKLVALGYPHE
ncbi:MAG TPA: class I adenylate-forming enzyme family protein, partial [Actinoplanes sp.]|nr:class I adenylate-forming enzyme family protein [Actinoplanes sp.]